MSSVIKKLLSKAGIRLDQKNLARTDNWKNIVSTAQEKVRPISPFLEQRLLLYFQIEEEPDRLGDTLQAEDVQCTEACFGRFKLGKRFFLKSKH